MIKNRPYCHLQCIGEDYYAVGIMCRTDFETQTESPGNPLRPDPLESVEATFVVKDQITGQLPLSIHREIDGTGSDLLVNFIGSANSGGFSHKTKLFFHRADTTPLFDSTGWPRKMKPHVHLTRNHPTSPTQWDLNIAVPLENGSQYYQVVAETQLNVYENMYLLKLAEHSSSGFQGEVLPHTFEIPEADKEGHTFAQVQVWLKKDGEADYRLQGTGTVKYDEADEKPMFK